MMFEDGGGLSEVNVNWPDTSQYVPAAAVGLRIAVKRRSSVSSSARLGEQRKVAVRYCEIAQDTRV